MRGIIAFALLAALSNAASIKPRRLEEPLYKIELAPGDEHKHFIDITDLDDEPAAGLQKRATFPNAVAQTTAVNALFPQLSQSRMRTALTTFSTFHNRYYTASYGQQSAEWLLAQVQSIISASGASGVNVTTFAHSFRQPSIIATIPGKSAKKIIVGAHLDSVNLQNRAAGRAPGAGSITILEAFTVLLTDSRIASGEAANTIEFHWYAGEEAGLLGSSAIFQQYSRQGADVGAMLNQDMTGYIKAGTKEVIGVITDNVDASLTAFLKKVIAAYTSLTAVDSTCGYGCSDHASATRAGYPAALAFESTFANISPNIHSAQDTLSTVDFAHVQQFAQMVVGFAYELGFATL
ncbi:hypothetical protein G7Z17_g11428 [Cylindrodendrum hubeiense]|uniref:Peptide hydrolase n=1 Tax=Cylindrodendrum hubeiense TaxID=595255 RepID=A0A9P5L3Y4_9HYPO|nr:hypothetical protein G7Z17_g11428 [Cylindrodendrum hubeiense]